MVLHKLLAAHILASPSGGGGLALARAERASSSLIARSRGYRLAKTTFSLPHRPGKAGRFSAAASVGPERSPLGTRTPVSLAFSHALRAYKGKVEAFLKKSFTKKLYSRYRSAPAAHVR